MNHDQHIQATQLYDRFLAERRQLFADQLERLRTAYPEVVADAERYQQESDFAPWEFYDAFPGKPAIVTALREKYGVDTGSRHRPPPEDTPPLTTLFFEAYALLRIVAYGLEWVAALT